MSHPREILAFLQAGARKSLSQNFLTSPHWAKKLVSTALEGEQPDEYWEIGPGLGALTEGLASEARKPVRIFEYDRKFSAYLETKFPNVLVEAGDFLEADALRFTNHSVVVISNLPYHLSSPILYKLNDFKVTFLRLVLTFQKEFAERLIAIPGTKAYGALSIICQCQYKLSSLGTLPKGAFFPIPEVASEALLLIPKSVKSTPFFNEIVKTAFLHRRKKLMSNLNGRFPKTVLENVFSIGNISQNARAEELSLEQYQFLCENLTSS